MNWNKDNLNIWTNEIVSAIQNNDIELQEVLSSMSWVTKKIFDVLIDNPWKFKKSLYWKAFKILKFQTTVQSEEEKEKIEIFDYLYKFRKENPEENFIEYNWKTYLNLWNSYVPSRSEVYDKEVRHDTFRECKIPDMVEVIDSRAGVYIWKDINTDLYGSFRYIKDLSAFETLIWENFHIEKTEVEWVYVIIESISDIGFNIWNHNRWFSITGWYYFIDKNWKSNYEEYTNFNTYTEILSGEDRNNDIVSKYLNVEKVGNVFKYYLNEKIVIKNNDLTESLEINKWFDIDIFLYNGRNVLRIWYNLWWKGEKELYSLVDLDNLEILVEKSEDLNIDELLWVITYSEINDRKWLLIFAEKIIGKKKEIKKLLLLTNWKNICQD